MRNLFKVFFATKKTNKNLGVECYYALFFTSLQMGRLQKLTVKTN